MVYSLNYKFDSVSAAGKISGTALELIKKYNELAKEAQGNGNYVEMEVFRQYAEHYRKIVTEINERKNQPREYGNDKNAENAAPENTEVKEENNAETDAAAVDNGLVETERAEQPQPIPEQPEHKVIRSRRRALKVVEVNDTDIVSSEESAVAKPRRRVLKRRNISTESAEQNNE